MPTGREQLAVGPSDHQKTAYEEQGFLVVPGVLGPTEVRELRDFFRRLFDSTPVHDGDVQVKVAEDGRGGGVRHDVFSRYPELVDLLVHPRITATLRTLLGPDFVFLPEMAAHDSRYGYWHKDTTPMERAGLDFHYEPDFAMVQCALYLQDNDEYGGGLDVVPGSHRDVDHTPPAPTLSLARRVAQRLGLRAATRRAWVEEGAYTVPTKAGDLVIFNMLLNHEASQPQVDGRGDIPPDKRKFATFFVCGANNEHSRAYRQFITPQYAHLRKGHAYPENVQELAKSHGLTLL